ncbi:MAG: helicase C-terminal domain-containing protein [Halomonas sp.]|nr:helicase C-terminal domain-containing protein [Halomonas sp.]MDM7481629.1 helicase C-terminal domain-containing protein [Halomonas sp.]
MSTIWLHRWVDAAYEALTTRVRLTARKAQVELSKAIAEQLASGGTLVAQAPTGTGKTLGYLVGVLAYQAWQREQRQPVFPVVVSTATKALQQQLFDYDLPKLVAAGLTSRNDVKLLRGRSNYLCLREAQAVSDTLQAFEESGEVFVDDRLLEYTHEQVEQVIKFYQQGHWSGDFYEYPGQLPKDTQRLGASADRCAGQACPSFSECAYYRYRERLHGAAIIVVNHDLLLHDLRQAARGGMTLFGAEINIIFDEAHHLPQKAIYIGTSEGPLSKLLATLPAAKGFLRLLQRLPQLHATLRLAQPTSLQVLEKDNLQERLEHLLTALDKLELPKDSDVLRFGLGKLPLPVLACLQQLRDPLVQWDGAVQGLYSNFSQLSGRRTLPELDALARLTELKNLLGVVRDCVESYLSPSNNVRWMQRRQGETCLYSAPLEAADVLNGLLWLRPDFRCAVMVSATLRDLEGFERYKKSTGALKARELTLPYCFDYQRSQLVVPAMRATPKPAQRQTFVSELIRRLPRDICPEEGTLVLFSSWQMLREVAPAIKAALGQQRVKVQGERMVSALVKAHREDIDKGLGSVLMGVATLAEGLDLPGRYCTHVAIVSLPFAVPTDPVEQEVAERLGDAYFEERSLPDATVRLTQMAGRLIRREDDSGRITVYDRRLVSTGYGRRMLKALPPFSQVIEALT